MRKEFWLGVLLLGLSFSFESCLSMMDNHNQRQKEAEGYLKIINSDDEFFWVNEEKAGSGVYFETFKSKKLNCDVNVKLTVNETKTNVFNCEYDIETNYPSYYFQYEEQNYYENILSYLFKSYKAVTMPENRYTDCFAKKNMQGFWENKFFSFDSYKSELMDCSVSAGTEVYFIVKEENVYTDERNMFAFLNQIYSSYGDGVDGVNSKFCFISSETDFAKFTESYLKSYDSNDFVNVFETKSSK